MVSQICASQLWSATWVRREVSPQALLGRRLRHAWFAEAWLLLSPTNLAVKLLKPCSSSDARFMDCLGVGLNWHSVLCPAASGMLCT